MNATQKRAAADARDAAITELRKVLRVGATVHCVLRRVSKSGATRRISFYSVSDNRLRCLDHYVARALGLRQDAETGYVIAKVYGSTLVSHLASTLYGGGFGCIGTTCPSSAHSMSDKDYTPHYDGTPRNSEEVGKDLKPYRHWHEDSSYALRFVLL